MKNWKLLTILLTALLFGCSMSSDYGSHDIQGEILEVDQENERILVEDMEKGTFWLDVSQVDNQDRLIKPLEVIVWLDGGLKGSDAREGKAKRVAIVK